MDHLRVIIAIALSFLVFIVWQFFFAPKEPVRRVAETTAPAAVSDDKMTAEKPYAQTEPPAPGTAGKPAESAPKTARTITVDTPLYRAEFSEDGAALTSFVLKKYREHADKDSALKQLVSPGLEGGTMLVSFERGGRPELKNAVFTADTDAPKIDVSQTPRDLVFTWTASDGLVIEKRYRFDPATYLVGLTIDVKNGAPQPLTGRLAITLNSIAAQGHRAVGFEGPSAFINNKLQQIAIKDIKDKNTFDGIIDWIAIQTRYFMSSLIPESPAEGTFHLIHGENNLIVAQLILPETTIKPDTQQSFAFKIFKGPKSTSLLNSYGHNLGKAINFGMFDILAKPCLWLMNFIYHNIVANYGIAIIILTLLTKLLLWPLGTKSYKSMSDMKKLAPLIKEIKEKYKDDRKRVNEETMALYRTYKINPLGGCLPMLVQIPVFFALYRMLYEAIELRHAPFFLWINDLSAPDRLFRFDFSIPFMDPPYGIPVLTLIMGATMFLQQKMSPPMGDATQAKMMMLMPVVFTFIFINFSSGLVLYWLVNNVVSISQQYYITKKNA
ncbi:MAG: membrane protein insertase YidC [Desulfobacterales bacterium]